MLQAENHRVLQVSICYLVFIVVRNRLHCRLPVQQANKHASHCVYTDAKMYAGHCEIQCYIHMPRLRSTGFDYVSAQ